MLDGTVISPVLNILAYFLQTYMCMYIYIYIHPPYHSPELLAGQSSALELLNHRISSWPDRAYLVCFIQLLLQQATE